MARIARSCTRLGEKRGAAGWSRRKKKDREARRTAGGFAYRGVAQTDSTWVKIAVLWKETLCEAIPPVTEVVDDGG
jgi:hypothetical protein